MELKSSEASLPCNTLEFILSEVFSFRARVMGCTSAP